ncbi:MAG: transcription initiation factor IIE [Clostridia bacterium]|nr:transcription initiation factor IIE [Clostridia bacterium]
MKYSESNTYTRSDLGGNVKKVISDLLAGRLVVEGQNVDIPEDLDMDVKVKYSVDETGGNVTLKITWDNVVEEEAAPEEEVF